MGFIARMFGFTNDEIDIMLLINVSCGVIGSLGLGVFLEKSKLYKTSNVLIGVMSAIATASLIFTLDAGFAWS